MKRAGGGREADEELHGAFQLITVPLLIRIEVKPNSFNERRGIESHVETILMRRRGVRSLAVGSPLIVPLVSTQLAAYFIFHISYLE